MTEPYPGRWSPATDEPSDVYRALVHSLAELGGGDTSGREEPVHVLIDADVELDRRFRLPGVGREVEMQPLPFDLLVDGVGGLYELPAGTTELRSLPLEGGDWIGGRTPSLWRHGFQTVDGGDGVTSLRQRGRLVAVDVADRSLARDADGSGWWVDTAVHDDSAVLHAEFDGEPAVVVPAPHHTDLLGDVGDGLLFSGHDEVLLADRKGSVLRAVPSTGHVISAVDGAYLSTDSEGRISVHRRPTFAPEPTGLRAGWHGAFADVAVRPGRFAVLVTVEQGRAAVAVIDGRTGAVRTFSNVDRNAVPVWAPDGIHLVLGIEGRPVIVDTQGDGRTSIPLDARVVATRA